MIFERNLVILTTRGFFFFWSWKAASGPRSARPRKLHKMTRLEHLALRFCFVKCWDDVLLLSFFSLSLSLSLSLTLTRSFCESVEFVVPLLLSPELPLPHLAQPKRPSLLALSPVSWPNKVRCREPSLLQQEAATAHLKRKTLS